MEQTAPNSSGVIQILPNQAVTRVALDGSIAAINQPLANLLVHIGLPTENVLSPVEERSKIIGALESVLSILPYEEKQKAFYLSKFTVAVTVGLFDGALAFLWDETVKALRKLIVSFDLQYFFNVAGTINSRYKGLSQETELEALSEHDLLEIIRRLGLINDVNFRRLEQVNYFRNHASSAHPNENDLSGLELLSYLEHCLKFAILAKPDHSVIQLQQLLTNIRVNIIPKDDNEHIAEDFAKQPQERIDDFIKSIFGLYCDTRQEQQVKTNIQNLIPLLWPCATEETKYEIGAKFGAYRKNGDVARKDSTQVFLELADGLQYKDEDSLATELLEKLQGLKTTHFEWNNFYNEYSYAKSISESLPASGIPIAVRKIFVKVICICWVGNGKGIRHGIDERAFPFYNQFLERFGVNEVVDFLNLFSDSEFVYDFDLVKTDARVKELAKYFKSKTTDVHINRALDVIISFPVKFLHKLPTDTRYKDAMKHVK
jgi:hypothetical protein